MKQLCTSIFGFMGVHCRGDFHCLVTWVSKKSSLDQSAFGISCTQCVSYYMLLSLKTAEVMEVVNNCYLKLKMLLNESTIS